MSTITQFVLWFLVVTMVATTGLLFFCIGHHIWDCYSGRREVKKTQPASHPTISRVSSQIKQGLYGAVNELIPLPPPELDEAVCPLTGDLCRKERERIHRVCLVLFARDFDALAQLISQSRGANQAARQETYKKTLQSDSCTNQSSSQ